MTRLKTWALLIFGALAVAYIAVFSPVQAEEAWQQNAAGARPAYEASGYLPAVPPGRPAGMSAAPACANAASHHCLRSRAM